jgi:hypothetical protein
MATSAKITEHVDALGRPLSIGDPVGYAHSNSMCIGTIIKMTAKMIRVRQVGKKGMNWRGIPDEGHLKYGSEMVLLEGPDVTMHLLRIGNQ